MNIEFEQREVISPVYILTSATLPNSRMSNHTANHSSSRGSLANASKPTYYGPTLFQADTSSESEPVDVQPSEAGEFINVYNAVAARRLVNVNLIWQTPALSITGQAFLFSTALSPYSSRASRIIASSLCIVVTIMTLQLTVKHRQSDASDGIWLESFERKYFSDSAEGLRPYSDGFAHGHNEKRRRHATSPQMGWLDVLTRVRSSVVWAWGMVLISLVALAILFLAVFAPQIFAHS
jgi:hypothetical protein